MWRVVLVPCDDDRANAHLLIFAFSVITFDLSHHCPDLNVSFKDTPIPLTGTIPSPSYSLFLSFSYPTRGSIFNHKHLYRHITHTNIHLSTHHQPQNAAINKQNPNRLMVSEWSSISNLSNNSVQYPQTLHNLLSHLVRLIDLDNNLGSKVYSNSYLFTIPFIIDAFLARRLNLEKGLFILVNRFVTKEWRIEVGMSHIQKDDYIVHHKHFNLCI